MSHLSDLALPLGLSDPDRQTLQDLVAGKENLCALASWLRAANAQYQAMLDLGKPKPKNRIWEWIRPTPVTQRSEYRKFEEIEEEIAKSQEYENALLHYPKEISEAEKSGNHWTYNVAINSECKAKAAQFKAKACTLTSALKKAESEKPKLDEDLDAIKYFCLMDRADVPGLADYCDALVSCAERVEAGVAIATLPDRTSHAFGERVEKAMIYLFKRDRFHSYADQVEYIIKGAAEFDKARIEGEKKTFNITPFLDDKVRLQAQAIRALKPVPYANLDRLPAILNRYNEALIAQAPQAFLKNAAEINALPETGNADASKEGHGRPLFSEGDFQTAVPASNKIPNALPEAQTTSDAGYTIFKDVDDVTLVGNISPGHPLYEDLHKLLGEASFTELVNKRREKALGNPDEKTRESTNRR